ncbi:MAG: FHA domain-containing protein [Prevotellaceae bacterium]|jgi:hypothetical protein|nr:FHA domain-containing protein [Prevotellaceae bacterium]
MNTEQLFILTCINPDCRKKFKMRKPTKGGTYSVTCPHCGKTIKVRIAAASPEEPSSADGTPDNPEKVADTHRSTQPVGDSLSTIPGKLVWVRKLGANQSFSLKEGSNTIGRSDPNLHSDIEIKNDITMSRRSVKIEVERDKKSPEKGYYFKLHVLKAQNPVMINHSPLNVGDIVSLKYGDTISLGRTLFRFEKDERKK